MNTALFEPTAEQVAIRDAAANATESLMVSAYAGCAKTTTLELIANARKDSGGLALAFNVTIKKELEKRFPESFNVLTLNGLGHRAFGKSIGKRLTLDNDKLYNITKAISKKYQINFDLIQDLRKLVTVAMDSGLIPREFPHRGLLLDTLPSWEELCDVNWIDPTLIPAARQALSENINQALKGVVSFHDQIYMSALFGGEFQRFSLVLVDEAQDLSPLNHIQIKKSAAGRIIAVGDPKQAIYAFRGADSNSMENLRKLRPEWIDLPLTTTFRCPKGIVERNIMHAPGFNAGPNNAKGVVYNAFSTRLLPNELPLGTPPSGDDGILWSWDDIQKVAKGDIVVISRNNAQIIAMAFKLLRKRISVQVLGREIGKSLIKLSEKIIPDPETPALRCRELIQEWMDGEVDLALANGKDEKVAIIRDRGESLLAVLESSADAAELRENLTDLFSRNDGQVTLCTGHRAKGKEWGTVIHLDPWRIPSKYALRAYDEGNPKALQQENNLQYIIETRAKQVLILANLAGFY